MGQSHSNKLSTQDDNKEITNIPSPTILKKRSLHQLKQKLTRSEFIALQHTFNKLKTVSNHLEYIELKTFLQHLNLPSPLEKAGILLFKSFSYLGSSYPQGQLSTTSTTTTTAPLLLTWDAFLSAFVILTGKLDTDPHDKTHHNRFEEAFFESLAILPPQQSIIITTTTNTTTIITNDKTTETTLKDNIDNSNTIQMKSTEHTITTTKGLSLADLGIQFDANDDDDDDNDANSSVNKKKDNGDDDDDDDDDEGKEKEKQDDQSMRILSSDLKELFILVLWIVHVEHQGQKDDDDNDDKKKDHKIMDDILSVKTVATQLINSIQSSKKKNQHDDEEIEESITHDDFYQWKNRNAPYLFKTIQSFIYTQFTMKVNYFTSFKKSINNNNKDHHEEENNEEEEQEHFDIILSQDRTPLPDQTDILTTNMCAQLSWSLPEEYFTIKQWHRLYSGDRDGFSMNRFESHVFKYPGPTLFLMKIQSIDNTNNNDDDDFKIIGGLITVPWKQGKHYWGNDQCFLFELYPTFECYRSKKGMNQQYVYCHPQFGFGFGGTSSYMQPPTTATAAHDGEPIIDQYMIYLDNSLQTGQYYHDPYPHHPTFEKSSSSSSLFNKQTKKKMKYCFETIHVEVFGLGNEKLTQLQKKAWQFETQEANRRAGVQIRQQDGQVDKEILRMAGIIQGDNDHYRHAKHQDRDSE